MKDSVTIRLSETTLRRAEAYRRSFNDYLGKDITRSAAIARLVRAGLNAEEPKIRDLERAHSALEGTPENNLEDLLQLKETEPDGAKQLAAWFKGDDDEED